MGKDYHNIAVIPGDLNGITVTNAALRLSEAVSTQLKKQIKHTRFDYNANYFINRNMTELDETDLAELAKYEQIFLGAIGDPTKIEPGVLERGILLKIRQAFDQYVNLRPIILPEGVWCPLKDKTHKDINFEICRENSEGLYLGQGWVEKKGTCDEAGYQIMKCTYKGVKRLAKFAEKRAKARKRGDKPTIHFVFKTNVLAYAGSPWQRVFSEYAKRDDIIVKYMHIDNFLMQMLNKPEQFDVVVTENMFGDIATDIGAIIQGGIGTAISGNINPTGKYPSMFEPVHGTAPDKWYKTDSNGEYIPGIVAPEKVQLIRPEAAFLSYAMMLGQIGEKKAAKLIEEVALRNMRDPEYETKKLDQLVEQACNFVKGIR